MHRGRAPGAKTETVLRKEAQCTRNGVVMYNEE